MKKFKHDTLIDCGDWRVEVRVLCRRETLTPAEERAMEKARRDVEDAIELGEVQTSQEMVSMREKEKPFFEAIFREAGISPIYLEETPNLYEGGNGAKAWLSPWYTVTTPVGHFAIGWRRSVMHLEWERTTLQMTANELITHEPRNVATHGYNSKWIYCKSKEQATKYIQTLAAGRKTDG